MSAACGRFRPRTIPGRDAAAFVTRSLAGVVYRYETRVAYHAPAAEVRRRLPTAFGAVEPVGERSCVHRTSDDDLDWLALRIAMPGVDFTVDGPPELVERLAAMGRRLTVAADAS